MHTWTLNNMFLNNEQFTEEIKREIKKIPETNSNENMTTQNLWDASESSSKREVYSNTILPQNQEKHRIDNLTLHLKQPKKEEKNTKISRRKEIIKIQAEINEKTMKETIVKINKTKSWFFEKVNKIDKPLVRLIKKKEKKINKIRNKKGKVTTDNAEMQGIIRDYYEQLYGNKMDNLEEMDILLEKFNLPRLNQEKKEIMNNPIMSIESDQKSLKKQKPRTRWLHRRILSNI